MSALFAAVAAVRPLFRMNLLSTDTVSGRNFVMCITQQQRLLSICISMALGESLQESLSKNLSPRVSNRISPGICLPGKSSSSVWHPVERSVRNGNCSIVLPLELQRKHRLSPTSRLPFYFRASSSHVTMHSQAGSQVGIMIYISALLHGIFPNHLSILSPLLAA